MVYVREGEKGRWGFSPQTLAKEPSALWTLRGFTPFLAIELVPFGHTMRA